jgi:hypothetical protein
LTSRRVNDQLANAVTRDNFLADVNASDSISVAGRGITTANRTKSPPPWICDSG